MGIIRRACEVLSICLYHFYVLVTAKIRNLKDYHYRMINSVSPLPSGVDIANTIKYFSQSLLQ